MYSKKGTAPPWVPVPLFRLQVVQNREREESFGVGLPLALLIREDS